MADTTTERDLGRVEGKLDMIISMLTGQGKDHEKLASRVMKLEIAVATLAAGGGLTAAKYFGLLGMLFSK